MQSEILVAGTVLEIQVREICEKFEPQKKPELAG
jgi:hypothetical protein